MTNFETKLKSKIVYQGKIITVFQDEVELKDKQKTLREVVRHKGGCCVAALNDRGGILMVKQFRYPYADEIVELPAGKLDVKGESPSSAAKRELLEETGYKADVWHSLGVIYPTPGYCDEQLYMYAAFSLHKAGGQSLDDGEFLDCFEIPFEEAVKNCVNGSIKDAKTITAVLKLDYLLKSGELTY